MFFDWVKYFDCLVWGVGLFVLVALVVGLIWKLGIMIDGKYGAMTVV